MRNAVVIGLVLCVGIFVGIGFHGIQLDARAAGGGGLATQNGDINSDGTIDLTDALAILHFLFQEGDPPVAIADTPETLARLAALEASLLALQGTVSDMGGDVLALQDSSFTGGDLIGITKATAGSPTQFVVRVNPDTGEMIPVRDVEFSYNPCCETTATDPFRRTIHFQGVGANAEENTLVSVNLDSGALIETLPLSKVLFALRFVPTR